MEAIQITKSMFNEIVRNKPSRFDMAINFYCCICKDDKYFIVGYYYNPKWDLFYPFYDDINKVPVFKESQASTYRELIQETDSILNIDLNEKLELAHKRFSEFFGCDCSVVESKLNAMYELKYSKTANLYTIYKLFNFIITDVQNLNAVTKPKNFKTKLFDLDRLNNKELVGNARWFCGEQKEELKKYAIKI